ncbi:MAG: HAMP domain-containing sensor histidine kinase [Rikenellaceae bacterium]|nr:HAMP domain-containing sensor histidine kinase [Rikenellaceae bacterium]
MKYKNQMVLYITLMLLVVGGAVAYIMISSQEKNIIAIGVVLIVSVVLLIYFSSKINQPMKALKEFIDIVQKGDVNYDKINFPDNEFGDVGEKIIQTFRQLDEAKKYKQQLTHNIAHELKTPVTSIRGYLETLMQQEMNKEQSRFFIERAYAQTMRLSSLISDISTLNNIEEAAGRYDIEIIKVRQCIGEIENDLAYRLSENKIRLDVEIDDHIIIEGVYLLIYSLFKNLIDNSIDHAGKGVVIHIQTVSVEAERIWFRYYDTGKGVPENHLDRLFERFYRVEAGRSRKSGGSGLGLSIVKNSVLLHNGTITVKNREEGGLQFDFSLNVKMYR